MIIKKFQGKTEEEATALAKKELGEGVVIMNVRSVKRKGLFAFFRAPLIEVTAALEDERERRVPSFTPLQKSAAGIYEKSAAGIGSIDEKLDSIQSLLEKNLTAPKGEDKPEEESEEKPESEEIKEEKDEEMLRFMKLLYKVMMDNEVDEKYINQVMDEIEKVHKPGTPFDYALSNAYQKLILKLGKPCEIKTSDGKGPKVIFFVGPTGVGKTTTIAKIASRFSVEEKKKVALLTADTYRIAAAEQLRTYANILQVPFKIIYTEEDMQGAIKEYQDYDLIFVDTAGHSHQNTEQKDAMKRLIHSIDGLCEKEVYLVLSVTTKKRDLEKIADSYKDMADYKLIFTKLDETTAIGNILNLKLYTNASLSYITCGQNVPDDIEIFNPQKMVKQLLGGR